MWDHNFENPPNYEIPTVRLFTDEVENLEDFFQIFTIGNVIAGNKKKGLISRRSIAILIRADSTNLVNLNPEARTLSTSRFRNLFPDNPPNEIAMTNFDRKRWYACHFQDPMAFCRLYSQLTLECKTQPSKWIFMRSREEPSAGGILPREDKTRIFLSGVIASSSADALQTARQK